MMSRCSVYLVAVLFALVQPLSVLAVDEAADQFFRGYLLKKDAEKLESEGNFSGALSVYQQMQQIFDGIAQSNPEWQPTMLNNRRSLNQQAISRVQAKLAQAGSTPAAAAVAPAATTPAFNPTLNLDAAAIPGAAPAPGGLLPSLGDVLTQWEQSYRQRLLQLETQNNQMQVDLGKWQQWYQWASGEITSARADKDTLAAKAAALEQSIAALKQQSEQNQDASRQLDALVKEKLNIEVEYRKATQRLATAEQTAKEASQKLTDATLRVSNLETERNKLLAERDTAVKERDELNTQNLGMKAEIEALKKRPLAKGEAKQIAEENERLKKQLSEAQKQVEALQADVGRKDQEIAQLRGQLTTLQGEMAALRQQSATYQTQVAELTLRLKQLQEAKPGALDPELAKENEVLREIVMRQLRGQYRQQQTKELVLAELQKMEGVSKALLEQVEELKNDRMTLTPEEEKLFTDPSVREMLGQNGIQGTLIAQVSKPAAPANPTEELINKANEAFAAQNFAEAAKLYEDVLRADPQNISSLIGLGYSRQRENKLAAAEAALKKCLTLAPENELAAFHLGVTHFKQQRWNDSAAAFEKSLAKHPQNARARHYLGIIATKRHFLDRAEREFKTALAIDPNYGDAHFNLAVLYATWDPPQLDKAKASYDEALKKGVPPDEALEKLLKNSTGKSVSAR